MTLIVSLLAAAFLPMLAETALSVKHERALREMGAVEPATDVIGLMRLAYPGAFLCMVGEAWMRQASSDTLMSTGAALFLAAQALKYWAIATLGARWTFRVLVPPTSTLITSGPYRFARHPNYVGVIGELVGFAVMAHAWISGPIATVVFLLLIAARIRVEERALGLAIQSRR
jgi:isoprenylcysteine carboxyl methyltransferase (ICMT) family protein YpbQ